MSYITVQEMTKRYGIDEKTLRKARYEGKLKTTKGLRPVRTRWGSMMEREVLLIHVDDAEDYVRNRYRKHRSAPKPAPKPLEGFGVYLDHKQAGTIPPHLQTAFCVYVLAVREKVDLSGSGNAVAQAARHVRLVERSEEAMALEDVCGAMVRWGA